MSVGVDARRVARFAHIWSPWSSLSLGAVVLLGLLYLLGEHLITVSNIVVLLSVAVSVTLLARLLALADRGAPVGAARSFFAFHVIFVQAGIVIIHFAAQRPAAEAALILGFDVNPSLTAVYAPLAGLAAFVMGVVIYASRFRTPVAVGPTEVEGRELSGRDRGRRARLAIFGLGMGVVYVALSIVVRGAFPLLEVLGGASAEAVRIRQHYGDAPYLFHSSIVQQVPLIVAPLVAMYLWESSRPKTRRRSIALIVWMLAIVLLANSLERTSIVIVGLWFGLAIYYRRRRLPFSVIAGIGVAFLAMTFLLHGSDLLALRNQVFRRVLIVNAMVNYFAFEHWPRDFGLLGGTTYLDYLREGVLGGGQTFARDLIGLLAPGQTTGTAPVGAITEGWVNFGALLVVVMGVQGIAFAFVDDVLRRGLSEPLGRVFASGIVVLLAATSYAGVLPVAFSGGLGTLLLIYVILRSRVAQSSLAATGEGHEETRGSVHSLSVVAARQSDLTSG